MLAIVVTEHNMTSVLQIILNTFMIASSMSAADEGPQPFTPLGQSVGRLRLQKLAEAPRVRYASSASRDL
jgi:hypothetical protein